jgi:hypothetical protein
MNLAVRLEVGRHHDGLIGSSDPQLASKHRYEDEVCIPSIQSYCRKWAATELILREPREKPYIPATLEGTELDKIYAFVLKARIFLTLSDMNFDKVVFFDNDIQVLSPHYNLWELPTLSGKKVPRYTEIFGKEIGLNFGLVVFDKATVDEFAELGYELFDEYLSCRNKKLSIAYDEFTLLSHINSTGRVPNFIGYPVSAKNPQDFLKANGYHTAYFRHWIGTNWV